MIATLRQLSAATSLAVLACLSQPGSAGETEIPDTGWLTREVYVPALDALCAGGTDLSSGCEAVRTREIVDASAYPWSAIGRFNFASIQIRMHCTGTLIGERLVLTAAHCLYNYWRKMWVPAQSIRFVAGYQRGGQVAYSKAVRYVVAGVHDTSSRHIRGGPVQDWALVELEDPIGAAAGFLGTAALDQSGLDRAMASGATIALAGYAQIREHVLSLAAECGTVRLPVTAELLLHRCAAMSSSKEGPSLKTRQKTSASLRAPGDRPIDWPDREKASRAVAEYLGVLDQESDGENKGGPERKPPKALSLAGYQMKPCPEPMELPWN